MSDLPVLVYDGDCAFCSSTIRFISRLIPKAPQMRPYQWLELNSLGLNLEQCRREVQFVISIDEKYSGSNAFANFFVHSPSPWKVLGYILKLPGIRHLSAVIYKWVAANRYRLPGGTPTCKMPKKD